MWIKELEEEANADRESLESERGSPYAFHVHLESVGGYEEAGWTRGNFKRAALPRDGSRHEFGP